jgi:hypothetical protein
MKRFRQWLSNGLAVLSLVFSAATVGCWVRSYWYQDEIAFLAKPNSTWFFGDWRGRVELTRQYVIPAMPTGWGAATSNYGTIGTFKQNGGVRGGASRDPHSVAPNAFYLGHTVDLGYTIFSTVRTSTVRISSRFDVWAVPFWLIALLFATYPMILAVRKANASRRSVYGLCHSCGYDLRATPERCPECGAVPQKKEMIPN